MLTRISALFSLSLLFFISCRKDVVSTTESKLTTQSSSKESALASLAIKDTSKGWYATYNYNLGNPDAPDGTLPDDSIIHNGVAQVTSVAHKEDIYNTSINYDIPSSHSIAGDSIVFEATIRNDVNSTQMEMYGSNNNSAGFHFDPQTNGSGQYFVYAGATSKTFSVYPATDFTTFQLVQFALRGNKAYLYVNSKLITSFTYTKADRLGKVQSLSIGYYKFVVCDRVRLLNSFTKKLLLKEEFNLNGKSNTIFY